MEMGNNEPQPSVAPPSGKGMSGGEVELLSVFFGLPDDTVDFLEKICSPKFAPLPPLFRSMQYFPLLSGDFLCFTEQVFPGFEELTTRRAILLTVQGAYLEVDDGQSAAWWEIFGQVFFSRRLWIFDQRPRKRVFNVLFILECLIFFGRSTSVAAGEILIGIHDIVMANLRDPAAEGALRSRPLERSSGASPNFRRMAPANLNLHELLGSNDSSSSGKGSSESSGSVSAPSTKKGRVVVFSSQLLLHWFNISFQKRFFLRFVSLFLAVYCWSYSIAWTSVFIEQLIDWLIEGVLWRSRLFIIGFFGSYISSNCFLFLISIIFTLVSFHFPGQRRCPGSIAHSQTQSAAGIRDAQGSPPSTHDTQQSPGLPACPVHFVCSSKWNRPSHVPQPKQPIAAPHSRFYGRRSNFHLRAVLHLATFWRLIHFFQNDFAV